jgi:hypothetical protein
MMVGGVKKEKLLTGPNNCLSWRALRELANFPPQVSQCLGLFIFSSQTRTAKALDLVGGQIRGNGVVYHCNVE